MMKDSILAVAHVKAKKIISQLDKRYQIKLKLDDQYLSHLINQKYNFAFGARGLEKLLQAEIEEKVATIVINNQIPPTREIILR